MVGSTTCANICPALAITSPLITVSSTQEMKDLLLSGMVDNAERRPLPFRALLIIISTIIALIIYTFTLQKIRDIALLKLIGARNGVIGGHPANA